MDATIDSYTQTRVLLSENDLQALEEKGEVRGRIWRTTGETSPLRVYIRKEGWKAEALPKDKPYEEKTSYEIGFPPDGLLQMRQWKVIGTEATNWRKIYMSLEGLF